MDTSTGERASFAKIASLGRQAREAKTTDELRSIWELLVEAVGEHPLPMKPVPDFDTFRRQLEAQQELRAAPRTVFHRDDGTVLSGEAARRAGDAWIEAHQARHRAALARLTPAGRRAYATYKRTGTLPARSEQIPTRARESRASASARRRGSSRRSSARSGDSGSDDGPSEEPPSRRRLCAFCGRDIPADRSPRATHCCDRHADRDRQRRKRARDRERGLSPRVPTTANDRAMRTFEPGEYERLLRLADCRCNGGHILAGRGDEPGPRCVKCGRQRPGSATEPAFQNLIRVIEEVA